MVFMCGPETNVGRDLAVHYFQFVLRGLFGDRCLGTTCYSCDSLAVWYCQIHNCEQVSFKPTLLELLPHPFDCAKIKVNGAYVFRLST